MALLQMVNSVRGKLREEQIAAFSASDELTTIIIDLINDAGSEILEGDDWTFDVRHDGRMYFPTKQSGTNGILGAGSTIYGNTSAVILTYAGDTAAGEVFADPDLAGFRMSDPLVGRLRMDATGFPNSSWVISSVLYTATFMGLTMRSNMHFTPVTGAWTAYANEQVLPTTVKQVLSVANEEQDISLEFVGRGIEFDSLVPRKTSSFSNSPEVVFVGSTVTSTARTGTWPTLAAAAARTGKGVMIWPIPSTDVQLSYSYRVQHADLSAETDSWDGVPADVIRIIEWKAVQSACDSVIQNDAELGSRAERQVEKRRARAQMYLNAQPNQRRVPTTFGRGLYHGNSRRRWASQTISAP